MFCKGFGNNFKKFLLKVGKELSDKAALALSITATLKAFLEGSPVSLGVLLTDTKVDDAIFKKVMDGLGIAIDKASAVYNLSAVCTMQPSLDSKLKCFMAEMKKLHPDLQNNILINIAVILTAHLDNNMQKRSLYDALLQGMYTLNK